MPPMPEAVMSVSNVDYSLAKVVQGEKWNDAKKPETDEMVKVICGNDKDTFFVRKSTVCKASRFFKTACDELPEIDDPKVQVDPKMIYPDTLGFILRYLGAIEPFRQSAGFLLPATIDRMVLILYRQARYLQVDCLTSNIVDGLRQNIDAAQELLKKDLNRWSEPEKFESSWKQVLINAQVVFSRANEDLKNDCAPIREIYLEFLHKNHGYLMKLGRPFEDFMRQTPDLAFVMLQDTYKNKDRSILAPKGSSNSCVYCGKTIGGGDPFFILVHARNDEVDHICRKVACRRLVKRREM